MSRRRFSSLAAAGSTLILLGKTHWLTGCSAYAPEQGPAYEPWKFPDEEHAPKRAAVHAALLAASPHNSQPWLFAINEREIDVFADFRKSLGAMDPGHREMHIGLGCAIENLMRAARVAGLMSEVEWLPNQTDESHVARVTLTAATPEEDPLYEFIAKRHTNRGAYLDEAPPTNLESELRSLITDPDITLSFLSGARKSEFREGTVEATEAIVNDSEMNQASHAWWRQTKDEIDKHRDGLTYAATVPNATRRYLGKQLGRPSAETAGEFWIDATKTEQTTGFAACVLSSSIRDSREQQLRVGRVYQQMHLWAASKGLAVQPLNQMAERQDREQQLGLPTESGARLAALTGEPKSGAQMLFRIGVAWDKTFKSPRRPLAWVLK